MYKVNPNTDQGCRSLLQKAVRRGNGALAVSVAEHLYEIGDGTWLKKRVGVIIAEECWPLMVEWELPKDVKGQQPAVKKMLGQAALSTKFKDAAGLGSLAYEFSEGDSSVLTGSEDDYHIRLIAAAVKNPGKYWEWAAGQCSAEPVARLVARAESAYKKGGWPWDKAFIQAAAYLAITDGLPEPPLCPTSKAEFPFWVALDKHTPQGKTVLRKVSAKTGIPWKQLGWISFYCESGHVDNATPSPWWNREVEWRLRKVGLFYDEAQKMWAKVKPIFVELLQDEAEMLQQRIGSRVSPYSVVDNGQGSVAQLLVAQTAEGKTPLYNIGDNGQLEFLSSLQKET